MSENEEGRDDGRTRYLPPSHRKQRALALKQSGSSSTDRVNAADSVPRRTSLSELQPPPTCCERLCVQGVVEFSLCLLFAKLVSYTFLFWLPLYITKAGERRAPTQNLNIVVVVIIIVSCVCVSAHLDAKKAGDLSTLFDVGGIVGRCFSSLLFLLSV